MANEWIIDVLEDLRSFARVNDMPTLAGELERTLCIALNELSPPARGASDALANHLKQH